MSGTRYTAIVLVCQPDSQLRVQPSGATPETMHIFVFVFLVNVVVGMALNGFVVLMNCKTWMRNKGLPAGDTIVTSLCLSRCIYQCLFGVYYTLPLFWLRVHLGYLQHCLALAGILVNYVSVWLASLLCVFYCVKITSHRHALILCVEGRMSKLVPWCLGLCVFFSLALCLPFGWHVFSSQYNNVLNGSSQNMTKKTAEESFMYLIGSSPPFAIFTIAFSLTIPSLWRHIRNMNGAGTSFRHPDMRTHYNAIKSMAIFFVLHMIFIVLINVNLSGALAYGSLYSSLMTMLSSFYPCLHSAVIIFYNRKLKQGLLFMCASRCGHNKAEANHEAGDTNT
ncbi:taste receptor type 2 member 39-like [Mantella aurantiaca]